MRIYYNYNEYKKSKRATDTSHFFNMILAYFEMFVGVGNIAGFIGLGIVFYEMLEGISDFNDLFLLFGIALLVAIVDSIVIYIHLSINFVCERMAINDDYALKQEHKPLILKEHKMQYFDSIKYCFSRFYIYLPFVLIGICSVSSLLFGLSNSEMLSLVLGALFTGLDVFLIFVIKRRLS